MNAGKSKVFEKKKYERIDFGKVYSVQKPSDFECQVLERASPLTSFCALILTVIS